MRNAAYFLAAFSVVVVIGLLSGCDSPHDRAARAYSFMAVCGYAPCDGTKAERIPR